MSGKISAWLDNLGLGQYATAFEENDIGQELLGDLDQETLKDIGISSAGHRLQILKAIKSEQIATPNAEASPAAKTDPESTGWSRTPGELKPVTMLFADIAGSTALTEKLDAETAHDVLYRATQIMCEAVERCNGTVCRFMGDGIMAMFGAPIASERHALEACRAALDMQAGIARYTTELATSHGISIQIRVGLHSGEVVVLEVGDDPDKPEYDASGPTVPLAARMEQSAATGTILITAQTRALAGDLVDAEEQPAITVKGVSQPIDAYRLTRILSTAESTAISPRHPIVGRKAELAQFRGLLEASLESGHGQTLYIRGEAGIGKTRLVEEMTRLAIEQGFHHHKALILDFGAGKGQGALPALVRSLFGIAEGSKEGERVLALKQATRDGIVESNSRVFLNDLLDLPQPADLKSLYEAMDVPARKEGKRQALVDTLTRLATRNAVFIVVEDLHWADSITLDYLARLANTVAECPALMVFTSRAEGDPIDTNWRASAGDAPIVTWDLSPLRKEESAELVSVFLDTNDSLAKRCIERAAGNPLFLEQLLLSVKNDASESVPDSIKSLVLSRMDSLPDRDKQALQAASVLGQRFDPSCLGFMLGNREYDCQNLVDHHLLRPEGTQYLFAHALIQEGAYTSLIKRPRLELHHKAADWYAERDLDLHAKHLDYAEDADASSAYLRAAREQAVLYRPERALQLIKRGLEIAPAAEQFEFHFLEGELFGLTGSSQESIDAFGRAAQVTNDDRERCRALLGQAEGLLITEDSDGLVEALSQAEKIALANTLNSELSRIYYIKGARHFNLRQSNACLEANRKSLSYARKTDLPEIEARALSGMADAEYTSGHLKSAFGYYDQCIEIARKNAITRVMCANLTMRGIMSYWDNKLDAMRADFHEAHELAEQTHHVRALMTAYLGGRHLASLGDVEKGEAWLQRGLALTSNLGWNNARGFFLAGLAKVAISRDEILKARKFAREAVDSLRQSDSGMAFAGTTCLGVLALTLEDPEQALATLKEAESYMPTGGPAYNYYFFEDAIDLCLQLKEWDKADRYVQSMENYTRDEPVARVEFFVARGHALAAYGRGNRDQGTVAELKRLREEAVRVGLVTAVPILETALSSV